MKTISKRDFNARYFDALRRACKEPSDAGDILYVWLRMNGLTEKFLREWEMLADTYDVEIVDGVGNPVDIPE